MILLKDLLGYVLLVAVVVWLLVAVGYAAPWDRDDDTPTWKRQRDDSYDVPSRPRIQTWMESDGSLTYLFPYGRTTMIVPLDQLTHPHQGPTFDPLGIQGQGVPMPDPPRRHHDSRSR